jgi:hypothetical protein
MKAYNVPWEKAVGVVDGIIRLQVDQFTGKILEFGLTSEGEWEVKELLPSTSVGGGRGEAVRRYTEISNLPKEDRTLFALAVNATGLKSGFAEAVAPVLAWAGYTPYDKQLEARQIFRTHAQMLIRALSINPRFPVAEQERIREELNVLPTWFDDPKNLIVRMTALKEALELRYNAEVESSEVLSKREHRVNAEKNARAIETFLTIMGDPSQSELTKGPTAGDPGAGKAPESFIKEGNDPALWPFIPEEHRKEWMALQGGS